MLYQQPILPEKNKQQRQINKLKKQEFAKSAKQAKNFAENWNCCAQRKATLLVGEKSAIFEKWLTENPPKSSQNKTGF